MDKTTMVRLLRRWKKSGQCFHSFFKELGISPSTAHYWKKKLSTSQEPIRGAGEEAVLPMSSGIEATHYQPFIQLSNPEITDTQIGDEQGIIIIYTNGNRLLLPSGVNLHLLKDCISFSV